MRRKKAIQQTSVENKRAPFVEVRRDGWLTYAVTVRGGDHSYRHDNYSIKRLSPEAARAFAERKLAKLVRELKWNKQVLHIEGKV